jgi:hypothetical protein
MKVQDLTKTYTHSDLQLVLSAIHDKKISEELQKNKPSLNIFLFDSNMQNLLNEYFSSLKFKEDIIQTLKDLQETITKIVSSETLDYTGQTTISSAFGWVNCLIEYQTNFDFFDKDFQKKIQEDIQTIENDIQTLNEDYI